MAIMYMREDRKQKLVRKLKKNKRECRREENILRNVEDRNEITDLF